MSQHPPFQHQARRVFGFAGALLMVVSSCVETFDEEPRFYDANLSEGSQAPGPGTAALSKSTSTLKTESSPGDSTPETAPLVETNSSASSGDSTASSSGSSKPGDSSLSSESSSLDTSEVTNGGSQTSLGSGSGSGFSSDVSGGMSSMDSASNSTGESVSTGSETVTDSASDTSSGTTSDNTETESETGTTSDESETESETDSDSSGTTPDPEGEEFMPQFGLKLPVLLEGSAPQSTSLRVQMMKIAMAPEDSAPGVQTAFQPAGIWRDWPLDLEENQGEVVLPTPAPEELEQGVSPRMALMVYDDQNQNRRFDPSESYIAGYSGHFRYASASAGKPERWSIDSRLANLATSVENTSFERPLLLSRIDAGKPVRGLSGTMANVDEEVAYLSTFSSAELADFQSAYLDQNRAFDLSLRDEEREEWTLRPQRAPAFGTEAMLAIPGIDANQLATLWIGGYQRPVDAAFAPDGSFLTPDSTMISRICNEAGDFPAALWIQGRDWITSPQGALYAVLYNLGPGWNFVTLEDNPEAPNSPIVVAGDRFSTPTYWIQADRCPAFPALEFVP